MAMYVNTNTAAMNTSRWLGINTDNMQSSLKKLSSGYKINEASDGPAGLVISEKLRAQINGLSQAVSNNQEASNVVGITEGAMSEMNDILKKMEQLAIHAANSGITSSDQVIADQAEMDSSVQTIDRIANTTKYSDTYLLNGSQQIKYSVNTVVDSSEDEQLINAKATKIYQIASMNTAINISYTGKDSTTSAAITTASAQKAVLEASSATAGADMNGTTITADLGMTITGSLGSKTYSFGNGQTLGSVAETINEDASSTGVAAQLVFDSAVTGAAETGACVQSTNGTASHTTATISVYELDKDFNRKTSFIASATLGSGAASVVVGGNTDADGNVYVKFTTGGTAGTYNIYKDAEMTTLVGTGTLGSLSTQANNSGLTLTVGALTGGANIAASDVMVVSLGSTTEVGTSGSTVGLTTTNYNAAGTGGSAGVGSVLTGVRLGENTDSNGKIYVKSTVDTTAGTVKVELFNDSAMEAKSLMATGTTSIASLTNNALNGFEVYAVTADGGNSTTGLYGTVNLAVSTTGAAGRLNTGVSASTTSDIYAYDMGIRLSSTQYGEDAKVTVEMSQGGLFADNQSHLIDKSNSGTDYGQSATVTVNGVKETVDQMTVTVASTELSADLVFDEGKLGATTIAVAGYTDGALASKSGAMTSTTNHATQTIANTSETVNDLTGGVQLQTGEGTNTYESTVISFQSMTADELGRSTFIDDFNGDGIKEAKTLTLTDLQSGGYASLATDTDKAMTIIKQSIDDVSMARARLGAIQSNMLETNINSLNVAIENITSTEAAIRDTDMSTESTEYTKNQILVQAATSMLAQANTLPQQALSLLQG